MHHQLTHWGRVTHICVGRLTIIARRQAIIWTNAEILLIGPLGTNFSEILIGIQTFPFTKMHLKMSSVKWCPFCLGLNVLTWARVKGQKDPDENIRNRYGLFTFYLFMENFHFDAEVWLQLHLRVLFKCFQIHESLILSYGYQTRVGLYWWYWWCKCRFSQRPIHGKVV